MWVKLTGVKAYTSKGKVYAYCRLTGTKLKNTPQRRGRDWYGDAALVLELAEARKTLPPPSSVAALVDAYRAHDVSVARRRAYTDLAARTRADYDTDFARLCRARIDGREIRDLTPADITMDDARALRDGWNRKFGATQAKRIMAACSVLWSYGVEYGWVRSNLWLALPSPVRPKGRRQANPPWDAAEFLTMLDSAPHIGLARAYALIFCGVRPENVVTVTLRQLKDAFRSAKTGAEHFIDMPDALRILFEEDQPSVMATNQAGGLPWKTYGQLRGQFERHRNQLAATGEVRAELTLKGLNHTLGSALAEAGATEKEMGAAMARTPQTVAHYARRANSRILSRAAFQRLSGWLNLSNGGRDVSNT